MKVNNTWFYTSLSSPICCDLLEVSSDQKREVGQKLNILKSTLEQMYTVLVENSGSNTGEKAKWLCAEV